MSKNIVKLWQTACLSNNKVFTKEFPEELIEEIRMSNDILSVVGEYVKLERKGKNYFGLCPFHSEKTPSFSVDPNKQLYYCFGCGKGGQSRCWRKGQGYSFPRETTRKKGLLPEKSRNFLELMLKRPVF